MISASLTDPGTWFDALNCSSTTSNVRGGAPVACGFSSSESVSVISLFLLSSSLSSFLVCLLLQASNLASTFFLGALGAGLLVVGLDGVAGSESDVPVDRLLLT